MVLQLDGVYVLGQAQDGNCPGLEIKSAVLYPQNSPQNRWMLADRCSAEDFLGLVAGLLEKAAVQPHDVLIGLGDGALWIENIFNHLGAKRITDVFHACEYLETIMLALDWDEATRLEHRKRLCNGHVNVRNWLADFLPSPVIWLDWDDTAQGALQYLETRLASMAYADFAKRGWPIGSGQVEAMNKAVIGKRLKQSGMHWSELGAAGMASLRAQICARNSLVDLDSLRFDAFAFS